MLALLDESTLRWRDIVDLVRGLVIESARATFEPGDRPRVTVALLVIAQVAPGMGLALIVWAVGSSARLWLGSLPRALGVTGLVMFHGCLIAFAFRMVSQHQATDTMAAPRPPFSRNTGALWIGAGLIGVLLSTWASVHHTSIIGSYPLVGLLASHQWPFRTVREMVATARRLSAATRDLTWAQLELERCEHLAASGAGAELSLEQARDNRDRLTRQRDEAIATLHAMGYRAQHERPPTSSPA
jgi:hypothetical protein